MPKSSGDFSFFFFPFFFLFTSLMRTSDAVTLAMHVHAVDETNWRELCAPTPKLTEHTKKMKSTVEVDCYVCAW